MDEIKNLEIGDKMNVILEKLARLAVFLVSGLEELLKTKLAFIKANWGDILAILIVILIAAGIGTYINYYYGFLKPVRKGITNGSIRVIRVRSPKSKNKSPSKEEVKNE